MATATKAKRPAARTRRGKASTNGAAAAKSPRAAIKNVVVEATAIDPERIDPSPFQPRTEFPDDEIRELADSIVNNGLAVPIIVRRKPRGKRFELIDGERRLRASKLAKQQGKLTLVRAEVQDRTDAECRALVLVTAMNRKELGPVEEARAMQSAIDSGDAAGPTELARQLGLSQGQVSNRLRLLKLPNGILKKVISREIPATHARCLVPFAGHPAVMKEIEKGIERELKRGELPDSQQFANNVHWWVQRVTKPMDDSLWDHRVGRAVEIFAVTPEQEEALGVIEVPDDCGETERLATNAKLWEKLRKTQIDELLKAKENGKKGSAKKPSSTKAKKEVAEEEKRKAKERAAKYRKWLVDWSTDWRRYLIAKSIRDGCLAVEDGLVRLLLVAGVHWLQQEHQYAEYLAGILRTQGAKIRASTWMGSRDAICGAVLEQDDAFDVYEAAAEFVARFFCDDKAGPSRIVPAADVWAIAEWCEIDVENAWLEEQAGPLLSEAYWNRQSKDQLVAQGKALGVELPAGGTKSDLVAAFVAKIPKPEDIDAGIDMPKELKQVKRPK